MNTQSMDYLAILDGAPPERQAAMIQAWMRSEPLPFFAQLRRERPVLVTPACTLVASFVDVRDCLQMPKVFTVDRYKTKMGVPGPTDGYLLATDADDLHNRETYMMQGLLNRNAQQPLKDNLR